MKATLISLLILSACVLMASKVEDRSAVVLGRKPSQEQEDKPEKGDKPPQDQDQMPKEPEKEETPKEEVPEKEVTINADLEVVGYAQKTVAANLIKIGLEFSSIACSVSEALAENSEKVRNAIKAIKSEGCKDEMITTVYFAITPKAREEKEMKDDGDKKMQNQHEYKHIEFDYIVTQTIEVTVSSKKQAVKIIDCSVSNGAVLLWVNWDISDKTEKYVKAYLIRAAIDDAVFKAKKVAKRLGFKLESVKKVKLNDGNPWVYANYKIATGTELIGINKTVALNVEITFNMVKIQKERKH
jgi:uncharacterized protein YggE